MFCSSGGMTSVLGGLLGLVGPPAAPWQPYVLAGPPGRSTCFCQWTWQGDECWEEGICLFVQALEINHKQLGLHKENKPSHKLIVSAESKIKS